MKHANPLRRARIAAVAAGVAVVGSVAVAHAADPSDGKVSKDSPTVKWTGSVAESYAPRILVIVTEDGSVPCQQPYCDAFKLNVADKDDLTIAAGVPEGTGTGASSVTLRIHKPGGDVLVATGDATPEKPFLVKIKGAATGDYVIDYFNNFVGPPVEYAGSATLGKGAAPPAPAPAAPGGGGSSGGGGPAPAPAQEDLKVTVKAGKASARKLARSRKLVATVSVSREVQSIQAALSKGGKVVGKGALGRTAGTAKLTLKLSRKLKAGTYSLGVLADDGKGVKATRSIKVKVAR